MTSAGARWRRKYGYYLRSIVTLLAGIDRPVTTIRIFAGLAGCGPHAVRLRRSGLAFRVRGATDVWSVKEAVLDDLYERHGFPIEPGWTVIDGGAGIGEFSLLAASRGATVVAFEPNPASFALLEENARLNDAVGEVRAFALALGGTSGPLSLDASPGDPVRARSGRSNGTTIVIDALSLADALDCSGIDRVDLLKLDCEGAEYDILFNASPAVLDRVDRIVLEYHDWEGEPDHGDLVRFLEGAGYRVATAPNPVLDFIGYLWAERRR